VVRPPAAGGAAIPPLGADSPFAIEAAGRWQEAAAAWRALGCPYETARALSGGDETAQREALAAFESLGARPMAERVRRGLRSAGVRRLPRGPLASTRTHAAGLTSKELAVLALLSTGLRNKEIALRLSRSTRAIDHHLQSIFAKLGVGTRAEGVSAAYRFGMVAPVVVDSAAPRRLGDVPNPGRDAASGHDYGVAIIPEPAGWLLLLSGLLTLRLIAASGNSVARSRRRAVYSDRIDRFVGGQSP
jgi:DNA-binding CsgD family transcriptional regulator